MFYFPCLFHILPNIYFKIFLVSAYKVSFIIYVFLLIFFVGGGRHSFVLCFCTLFALIKRATGAYRSCRSLQKERQERCALVTLYKITGAIHSGCSLQKEQKSEEQKSDLLFLRVALKRKHQTRSFHPAFPLCMPKTKERIL